MPETSKQLPLGLLTFAAAAAVAASQFTAAFGLTTLLADLVKGAALLAAAVGWWQATRTRNQRQAGFGGSHSATHRPAWGLWLRRAGTGLLFLLACWSLWPPLHHLIDGRASWTVCGEFRSACAANACLVLRDRLGRPLRPDCLQVEDLTGFRQLRAQNHLEYQPYSIGLRCQDETIFRELDTEMFSETCEGEMQW